MPKRHPASPDDWSVAYTRTVAGNIRAHRERRRMSVQALADRCTALGYPLERTNLNKLESGGRASMSVAELLVLARALDTPPMLLLVPLHDEPVEILPGVEAPAAEAAAWLDGTAPAPDADDTEAGEERRDALRLLRDHHRAVEEWTSRSRAARTAGTRAADDQDPNRREWREAAHQHADQARHAADRLGFLRDGMRLRGVPLPELPPGLIHLDDTPA
ncbi:helix-turn-helix domain-containing protein [Nonomuraea sp. NPDC050394]|uniref:helix-turn-helix domain-containing protein n=1 Tax=Nonomuraea sp. NPDC050394 TaxID=3364363 RepID=UPI003787E0F6